MRVLRLLAFLLALPALVRADRLFTSGAETNSFTTNEWTGTVGTPTFDTGTVHSGTYSIQANPAGAAEVATRLYSAAGTSGTYFVRFYVNFSSLPTADAELFRNSNAAGSAFGAVIEVDVTGGNQFFQIRNNLAATTATCSNDITTGTWYRVEMSWLLSDTVGTIELRQYAGESASADCNVSLGAADTLPTDGRVWSFGANAAHTYTAYFDDFAVNTTGGSFATWPGPGYVAYLEADGNVASGFTATGAGCTGAGNYDCVNDLPGAPDDLTTYNNIGGGADNVTDQLSAGTLPAGMASDADVILVHVYARMGGASNTGTNQGRLSLWDSAVETNGPTTSSCDVNGWTAITDANDLTYDPGADTKANVEAYDLGYESVSLAQTCRTTALWANVEWRDAPPAPTCTVSIALMGVGCR